MSSQVLENTHRQHVKQSHVTVGDKHYTVSTVELAFRHPGGIYETMVFPADESGETSSYGDLDMARYETREEALAGHDAMVMKWDSIDTDGESVEREMEMDDSAIDMMRVIAGSF